MDRVDKLVQEAKELRENILRTAARLDSFTEILNQEIENLRSMVQEQKNNDPKE